MSADNVLRLLHTLALFMMVSGMASVLLPLLRAWRVRDVGRQIQAFDDADTAKVTLLVPGAIFVGITGFAWAIQKEYDFVTTGWLLALIAVYLFAVGICLPLINFGLRRVQLLALQAHKKSELTTPELEDALADNVPIVFGFVFLAAVVVMAWLAVFKPF